MEQITVVLRVLAFVLALASIWLTAWIVETVDTPIYCIAAVTTGALTCLVGLFFTFLSAND